MVLPEKTSRPSAPKKLHEQQLRRQSLPSPALCCACGLCIMLAGINITLVGAFAFGTFIPTGNAPIVIGPLLLLVALAFFAACCVVSRRPPARPGRESGAGEKWGLMGRMGVAAAAAFEMETSEHTLQDTTAVQLSPTNSPSSSRRSGSSQGGDAATPACQEPRDESDDPTSTSDGGEGSSPAQMPPAFKTSST